MPMDLRKMIVLSSKHDAMTRIQGIESYRYVVDLYQGLKYNDHGMLFKLPSLIRVKN